MLAEAEAKERKAVSSGMRSLLSVFGLSRTTAVRLSGSTSHVGGAGTVD